MRMSEVARRRRGVRRASNEEHRVLETTIDIMTMLATPKSYAVLTRAPSADPGEGMGKKTRYV